MNRIARGPKRKQLNLTLHDWGKNNPQRLTRFIKIHEKLGNGKYIHTFDKLLDNWEETVRFLNEEETAILVEELGEGDSV